MFVFNLSSRRRCSASRLAEAFFSIYADEMRGYWCEHGDPMGEEEYGYTDLDAAFNNSTLDVGNMILVISLHLPVPSVTLIGTSICLCTSGHCSVCVFLSHMSMNGLIGCVLTCEPSTPSCVHACAAREIS